MSVGPTRGPVQRPGDDRDFTEIFQRLDDIERARPQNDGPRHVYGRLYDDAATLDAGSGDWTALPGDTITITIDPPFTEGYSFVCTPNDNGDSIPDPPVLMPVTSAGLGMSGFVMGYQVDLATVEIVFWDLDGNVNANRCGFDFVAVGT